MAFTNSAYTVPNVSVNGLCVKDEHSLPLPPAVQLRLNKPAPVAITVNVTVKGEDTQCKLCVCTTPIKSMDYKKIFPLGILAVFPVGDTIWTMNDSMLLSVGYDSMQLGIKLPENSDVNVIISSPYQASAVIGMYFELM